MLHIIVGWAKNLFASSHVEVVDDISVPVTRAQLGYRFQRYHFEQLFNGISEWPSVEFLDAYGDPITSLEDVSEGPDGGIDAVIRIVTRTERGARIVAARIRNKMSVGVIDGRNRNGDRIQEPRCHPRDGGNNFWQGNSAAPPGN
jgi:hypothetical protein